MSEEQNLTNGNGPHPNRRSAIVGMAAVLLLGEASHLFSHLFSSNHEQAGMSAEHYNSLLVREAFNFYNFLNSIKPGELKDTVPSNFQRVIVVDGQMVLNPISPLKVDVAGQIVTATQTLLEATGGNSQDANQSMSLFRSLTTPQTRDLLAREGVHVQTAQPSGDLGVSGVDEQPAGNSNNDLVYYADFITPQYPDGSNQVLTTTPGAEEQMRFGQQLANFQQRVALQSQS